MNSNNKSEFKINITYYKILKVVEELNNIHKYPSNKGVGNILRGVNDVETSLYASLHTYGTLLSLKGRKLNSHITNLIRHKYLNNIYDKKTNRLFLYITEKGEEEISNFAKHHKVVLSKKNPQPISEIVEI